MAQLPIPFDIQAVIFDKDGTLIDFYAMWAAWVIDLAQRLEAASATSSVEHEELKKGLTHDEFSITERLFRAMDFDPTTGHVIAGGHLAVDPMARLRALTVDVVRAAGLDPTAAEQAVEA